MSSPRRDPSGADPLVRGRRPRRPAHTLLCSRRPARGPAANQRVGPTKPAETARRAEENSPRREPWVAAEDTAQPLQGRKKAAARIFRPFRAFFSKGRRPRACSLGYSLSPFGLGLAAFLLTCLPALAAVTGTLVNGTTGKPQPGAAVTLFKLDENGLTQLAEAKSDAQGAFAFGQNLEGPGLLRSTLDGVTYTLTLQPGAPATGITLNVFNASREPGEAKIAKHMLLFQPAGGQMKIDETFLFTNAGKTSWNDPGKGTLHFYLPAAAGGKAEVNATAPGGMPIAAELVKGGADVFGIEFPIKPGETRIDIGYTVPYREAAPYEGKIVTKDGDTYLIAPNGVKLEGAGLNDLGQEPKTQAHIYGLTATAYKITLTGTPLASEAAGAEASADSAEAEDSGPQVETVLPHVFGQAKLIVALALGVLALGFAVLYRAGGKPKETNERRRG